VIFETRCPHCSALDVVAATAIGSSVQCTKCGRGHPVHPKAGSAVEGLLAAILEEQRAQNSALGRLAAGLYTLRVMISLFIVVVLLFGVRVSLK
jgi:ribosomal protein S27E